jgi:hypothetical protein
VKNLFLPENNEILRCAQNDILHVFYRTKSKCKNLSPANWVGFVKTFGLTGFGGGDKIQFKLIWFESLIGIFGESIHYGNCQDSS